MVESSQARSDLAVPVVVGDTSGLGRVGWVMPDVGSAGATAAAEREAT